MTKELKELIEEWKEERNYRDCGASAKVTYAEIKKLAKPKELIKLLEDELKLSFRLHSSNWL